MRTLVVIAALGAVGCQDFTDLEEACHDVVPGEGSINNNDAVKVVNRTNCYRRVTGLSRGRLQKHVQAAVESHVKYISDVQPDLDRIEFEQSTIPGYSGYDVLDRLEAAEYNYDDTAFDMGVWDYYFLYRSDLIPSMEDVVDILAEDPYSRQVLLQPSWVASGFDVATYETAQTYDEAEVDIDVANFVVVYEYPASQRAENPVVYPKDGQVKVPTSVLVEDPTDPLCGQVVGYPITVTVGSNAANRGGVGGSNPYGLEVLSAGLHGPNGAVPVDVRAPGDLDRTTGALVYTVAVFPKDELEVGAQYQFDAAIRWADGDKDISTTFRTASAAPELDDPAAIYCVEQGTTTTTDPTIPTGGGTTDPTVPTGTGTGGTGGGTTGTEPTFPTKAPVNHILIRHGRVR